MDIIMPLADDYRVMMIISLHTAQNVFLSPSTWSYTPATHLDLLPLPGAGGGHLPAGRARLLLAAARDGVVQRVVPLAPDHLRQDAAPRVDEPVAHLKGTDIGQECTETSVRMLLKWY